MKQRSWESAREDDKETLRKGPSIFSQMICPKDLPMKSENQG
eukprot:CAMPEP_0198487680 /NCGR_PEP_ID=MMETSP1462-20131121/210_1 /TAXON_ID=1333877 /ORGANISM="Brandtodinium nutriculum, Strain RCC3387" /LENGTH=41 /DNA_ID= /DNA_START= /DNA_END= /DNA_ORIENTATION=